MFGRFFAAGVALLIAALPSVAAAQAVCVDCAEPERNYKCTVKDADRVQNVRGIGRGLEFLCISEIARANGHRSCRVNTTFAGPCIGQPYEIDLTRSGTDNANAAPRPGETPADAPAKTSAPAAVPVKKGPPQTVEELAKDTMAKSKEQFSAVDEKMREAGSAVGNAVKKSWNCLSSLFKGC